LQGCHPDKLNEQRGQASLSTFLIFIGFRLPAFALRFPIL